MYAAGLRRDMKTNQKYNVLSAKFMKYIQHHQTKNTIKEIAKNDEFLKFYL